MHVEADRGLLRDRTDFSVTRYVKDTTGRSIHRASAKCTCTFHSRCMMMGRPSTMTEQKDLGLCRATYYEKH